MRTIQIRFSSDVTNTTEAAQALLSVLDCGRVVSSSEGIATVEIPGFEDDAELEELWSNACDEDDRVVQWM